MIAWFKKETFRKDMEGLRKTTKSHSQDISTPD
jgi:hypothetical protein